VTHRGAGEELPPELKAVEAELAGLCPRDDRLDRERLVFLAGQASLAGRPGPRAAWAWPASLAGMTAVAATLLAMLLARPEPAVVERIRIVKVPVEQRESPAHPDDSPAASRLVTSQPGGPAASTPADDLDWRSDPDWPPLRTRASDLKMLDRMLAHDADPWTRPVQTSVSAGPQTEAPLPYHQWLKSLFDEPSRAALPGDWPSTPSNPGASS